MLAFRDSRASRRRACASVRGTLGPSHESSPRESGSQGCAAMANTLGVNQRDRFGYWPPAGYLLRNEERQDVALERGHLHPDDDLKRIEQRRPSGLQRSLDAVVIGDRNRVQMSLRRHVIHDRANALRSITPRRADVHAGDAVPLCRFQRRTAPSLGPGQARVASNRRCAGSCSALSMHEESASGNRGGSQAHLGTGADCAALHVFCQSNPARVRTTEPVALACATGAAPSSKRGIRGARLSAKRTRAACPSHRLMSSGYRHTRSQGCALDLAAYLGGFETQRGSLASTCPGAFV